ncbi:MAG: hypothetical protein K9J13_10685 [Saprospiraceae bacterium]|nr:hypothetical protein [Saprospiraceae bacterium]
MKRVAIPIVNNKLSESFGQCSHYEIFEIDDADVKSYAIEIPQINDIAQLPEWASKQGITDIIAYEIDKSIINLFVKFKINLFVGIAIKSTALLIEDYIKGSLKSDDKIISKIMLGV